MLRESATHVQPKSKMNEISCFALPQRDRQGLARASKDRTDKPTPVKSSHSAQINHNQQNPFMQVGEDGYVCSKGEYGVQTAYARPLRPILENNRPRCL